MPCKSRLEKKTDTKSKNSDALVNVTLNGQHNFFLTAYFGIYFWKPAVGDGFAVGTKQ